MPEPRKIILFLNDAPETDKDASRIVDAETGEVICYISAVSEVNVTNHLPSYAQAFSHVIQQQAEKEG